MRPRRWVWAVGAWVGLAAAAAPAGGRKCTVDYDGAWTRAHLGKVMTADQTKAFMKRLADYVRDHHLKTKAASAQRGMVYEYSDVRREGQFDQWVQGEGLDTMHDGAWFAAAMVNACRTTGEAGYRRLLSEWQLPFYCKMLNHSDELFTTKGATARKGAMPWGKPWALQEGEKGFVPYWWDDGASVSLERRRSQHNLTDRPSVNRLAGKDNPKALLDGYSLGMSNHMAQDLGVMVQLAWLMLRQSDQPSDRKQAAEVAEAARNLHACRVRHFGVIPMCAAPAALASGDAELMRRVQKPARKGQWPTSNHYTRALREFEPDKRLPTPGFADGLQYRYYYGIARAGGRLPRALAFLIVYDAYTEPMLFRYHCDDWRVPAGINRFDLYGLYFQNGKPQQYRSDRKGPYGWPVPIGSRMGPQNMICCGWAAQILRAMPGLWEQPYKTRFAKDVRVYVFDPPPPDDTSRPRPAEIALGKVTLQVHGTRSALCVASKAAGPLKITVFDGPDGKGRRGRRAVVTVAADGKVSAVNHRGEALLVKGAARRGSAFRFELPYTAVKGQKPWANGVEHGRYSLRVGEKVRNFYLASPEAQVAAWVRHELAGGLRTWEAIFRDKGFIATGLGRGGHWDHFSDTGGYAHLISAAAQWLLCLAGRNDWQMHNVPAVLK